MTKNQIRAMVTIAVAQAIQELGEVPSGHLYANLMGVLSLEQYQAIIQTLKDQKLISESMHLLKWIGPTRENPLAPLANSIKEGK